MTGVHLAAEHISDFGLLCIEGKTVRDAGFWIVEFQREFVDFIPAVGRVGLASGAEFIHLSLGHGREVLSDLQVLVKHFEAVDAGNGGSDGQTHGVAQGFFRCNHAVLDGLAMSIQGLHTEGCDAALIEFGQDLLLEAAEIRIEGIERHLDGVERKTCFQHGEMNFWILMTSEPYEADLAVFLSLLQRFGGAVPTDEKFRVIIEGHAVDLPEIEMIGLQAAEGFFEHLEGEAGVAAVGAGLGHQKDFVAAALEAGAHPNFGFAPAVFPAVVEEGHPTVDRLMNDFNGGFLVGSVAKMVAAKAECRNFGVRATELSERDGSAGALGHFVT